MRFSSFLGGCCFWSGRTLSAGPSAPRANLLRSWNGRTRPAPGSPRRLRWVARAPPRRPAGRAAAESRSWPAARRGPEAPSPGGPVRWTMTMTEPEPQGALRALLASKGPRSTRPGSVLTVGLGGAALLLALLAVVAMVEPPPPVPSSGPPLAATVAAGPPSAPAAPSAAVSALAERLDPRDITLYAVPDAHEVRRPQVSPACTTRSWPRPGSSPTRRWTPASSRRRPRRSPTPSPLTCRCPRWKAPTRCPPPTRRPLRARSEAVPERACRRGRLGRQAACPGAVLPRRPTSAEQGPVQRARAAADLAPVRAPPPQLLPDRGQLACGTDRPRTLSPISDRAHRRPRPPGGDGPAPRGLHRPDLGGAPAGVRGQARTPEPAR